MKHNNGVINFYSIKYEIKNNSNNNNNLDSNNFNFNNSISKIIF